jgi:hypothetical protein
MFGLVSIVHVWTVCRVRNFWEVTGQWFDNGQYLQLATIIRNWRATGEEVPHHFWGFPFAIAGISKLFSIPDLGALVLISMLGSLVVCVLVHRLYGGWVALAFFFFINYQWIFISMEGGSEPLFMCLLFAAFLAARSESWNLAALLASLSTTVRPVGVFALVGFAAVLVMRRSYRQLAVITLIALAVGVLYVVPLWIILGSPFANFTGYRRDWETHGWLITYPFGALISNYLTGLRGLRWPNFPLPVVWLVLGSTGITMMWLPRNRQGFLRIIQPEVLFASFYTLFLVSFNAADYIAYALPRYLIPVLPTFLFSLRDWIPRDRRVLWTGAVLSALLASAAQVGFKNVFGFRLP